MQAVRYGSMEVAVYGSNAVLGQTAADDLTIILNATIAERGETSIILATGNSQLSFVDALRKKPNIDWSKVSIFHMDEYLGVSDQHPASFRRWMREQLVDIVHPCAFYGIQGNAPDVDAEMARYAALIKKHEPVACVLGIGENGHLAFNDPPANFGADEVAHVVTLVDTARQQQVGEGHFSSLNEVPRQAITLTVPALLRPPHVLAVVPERRKAQAVKAALEGPITPDCPASILRTVAHAKLYLDIDSASLLERKG